MCAQTTSRQRPRQRLPKHPPRPPPKSHAVRPPSGEDEGTSRTARRHPLCLFGRPVPISPFLTRLPLSYSLELLPSLVDLWRAALIAMEKVIHAFSPSESGISVDQLMRLRGPARRGAIGFGMRPKQQRLSSHVSLVDLVQELDEAASRMASPQQNGAHPTFASTSPSSEPPSTVIEAPPLSSTPDSPGGTKRIKLSDTTQAVAPAASEDGDVAMQGVVGGSSVEKIPAAEGADGAMAGQGSSTGTGPVVEEQVFALTCTWKGSKVSAMVFAGR